MLTVVNQLLLSNGVCIQLTGTPFQQSLVNYKLQWSVSAWKQRDSFTSDRRDHSAESTQVNKTVRFFLPNITDFRSTSNSHWT